MIAELLAAQDGLARLEGEAGMAPEDVREGLVARMGVREAGGWLAHHGSWVHPVDLALREAGVVMTRLKNDDRRNCVALVDPDNRPTPLELPHETDSSPPEDRSEDGASA